MNNQSIFISDEYQAFKLTAETNHQWISESNWKQLTDAERAIASLRGWYVLVDSSLGYFSTNEMSKDNLNE